MKKFTLILFLTVLLSNLSIASNGYNKTANYYLNEKGKIVFRFKTNSKEQFNEINKLVSVIQKKSNTNALSVVAYADKKQFEKFLSLGIDYQIAKKDNVSTSVIDCGAPVPDMPSLPTATGGMFCYINSSNCY